MRPGVLRDVDLRDIGFDAPGRVYEHIPSPWGVLGRILRRGEITREDVFIDIGCGMGPVLVEAAARYDFGRVIGIDLVPEFTEVARDTIARARRRLRCQDVQVVAGDAIGYRMPDDVTVIFMADPFRGPLFDAVVAKLITSVDRHPRRLRIIYSMPIEGGRLERTGRARLVRYGRRAGRPWATAPDLAMYEILPSGDGADSHTLRPPRSARGLAKRLFTAPSPDGRGSRSVDASYEAQDPTIQIETNAASRGARVVFPDSTGTVDDLRAAFEHQHCVRLPRFLSGGLLDRIQRYVDEGEFSTRAYGGNRAEHCMEDGKAVQLLTLLTNDPYLFELVRKITRCGRIGAFDASLYRVMPVPEHEDPWHGEIFGHGMVAMSIDLSRRPYSGGVLEIRDRYSHEVLYRLSGVEPGDAMIVRLAPFLQRRVTAVEGDSPRTVYAGRFMRSRSDRDSKLARVGSNAR
jgi:SAM-dependent methyltransferase